MPLKIVLVHPLIPQNTGSTARLTAATRSELHLIEPLGFEINDANVKRAGLDYWPEVILFQHSSWTAFLEKTGAKEDDLWFYSKRAERSYVEAEYRAEDFLVLGNETAGLPQDIRERYAERLLRIPMENENVRSLNLSNCASIVLYEARRQLGMLEARS